MRLSEPLPSPGHVSERGTLLLHIVLVLAQLVAVMGTFLLPNFRRTVGGVLGQIFSEVGISFDTDVNFVEMTILAARGGGWNYLVAGTFLVFNLVTPTLRALSLLAVLTLPLSLRRARALYTVSRLAVAFSALDVMLVATPLISATFKPFSAVILDTKHEPCVTLLELYPGHSVCLEILVTPEIGYWFNVAAVVLMLFCGYDGSPTAKWIHRRLYPHDQSPPPSLVCVERAA